MQQLRQLTMAQAVREALIEEMRRDSTVYVCGETVGGEGGIGRIASGLGQEFGPQRVRDTPISEPTMAGSAVGAALFGYRPVVDFMLADFMFVAFDEIISMAGKWRYMHAGQGGMKVPVVFYAMMGGYTGATALHSQAPVSYFMHAPGIKVVVPSTAYDAKGLFKTAIRDDNAVLFFMHKLARAARLGNDVPEEEYLIPFGVADIKREGTDVTVVATSYMVHLSMAAAEDLEKEGISIEVIDPRTLEPLDMETILKSVRKTGRVVVVDEDNARCSAAAEIGMQIVENCFYNLEAPVQRVCAENVPIPYAQAMESRVLPSKEKIIAAVKATLDK